MSKEVSQCQRRRCDAAMHEALGARFTDFGGWEMPLQYEGVIAEHMAVRQSVGVFDVSHLGRFPVDRAGCHRPALRQPSCATTSPRSIPGRAQYTMALNEAGGRRGRHHRVAARR